MKKTVLSFTLFIICFNINSQNIIPNADWEQGPAVSTDYTTGWTVNGPTSWVTTEPSPDRIYAGSFAAYRDNHTAQSGSAYVMFYGPYNEAGKCTLITPIVAGTNYTLSYWLDVDDNFDGGAGAIRFRFIGGDSITSPYVNNTGSWQYFNSTFTATMNATELELVGEGLNLTKIDNMSLSSESIAASINESENNNDLLLYPNPSSGIFQISDFKYQIADLKVINVLGKCVFQSTINNNQSTINLSSFAKGIYFVEIRTEAGVVNKKVVVQ